jgi:starch phosphorylase
MAQTALNTVLDRFQAIIGEDNFRLSFLHHLRYTRGKDWKSASPQDKFECLALAVRDRVLEHMIATQQTYHREDVKRVYYFSMEFLVGRQLLTCVLNLGIGDLVREALHRLGCDFDELADLEPDPALGNGGLGRLAACYLESLATLGYPAHGYGICYELGLFRQRFDAQGRQVETPDDWLSQGYPWLLPRPEHRVECPILGRVGHEERGDHKYHPKWVDYQTLLGQPWDLPVVGYGGRTVNLLRLFRACSDEPLDMDRFNQGDFVEALHRRVLSETVSRVLYPVDATDKGRRLRLAQEYFLVACGIRDIIRRYRKRHDDFGAFADQVAIQLNDTHPALAVAELHRYFIDEVGLEWDVSWGIVRRTFSYTNHTLMPEALERWPTALLKETVPRHVEILEEIDRRFLQQAEKALGKDYATLGRLSLFERGPQSQVRMANVAVVGSHTVNGVAAIHSRLLTERLFPDFARLWPERFTNVTNGITPRRWLLAANPALSAVITGRIGAGWITDLDRLAGLEAHVEDASFLAQVAAAKQANKERLAALVKRETGIDLPVTMIFDVHAKRLHEYKRQLLNVLNVVDLYLQLRDHPELDLPPRACIFAAKAAPGYWMAKLIIQFTNAVAEVVNADPGTRDRLRVVFVPDYRVTLSEVLIPAADLSEQISLAGTEASGTGNMKFALNGALTIGTLDGANIEIRDAVGPENIFIFGMTVAEVDALRVAGYRSAEHLKRTPRLEAVFEAIEDDLFSPTQPGVFRPLVDALLGGGDHFMLVADYASYAETRARTGELFRDRDGWLRKVVRNIARMGPFSSDRSVREYAERIWHIRPVEVPPQPAWE